MKNAIRFLGIVLVLSAIGFTMSACSSSDDCEHGWDYVQTIGGQDRYFCSGCGDYEYRRNETPITLKIVNNFESKYDSSYGNVSSVEIYKGKEFIDVPNPLTPAYFNRIKSKRGDLVSDGAINSTSNLIGKNGSEKTFNIVLPEDGIISILMVVYLKSDDSVAVTSDWRNFDAGKSYTLTLSGTSDKPTRVITED